MIKYKWHLFLMFSIIGFGIDIATKYLAVHSLRLGESVPVFGSLLQWQLVYNNNIIFGLNPRALIPGLPVNLIFYILSGIAIVFLVFYYKNIKNQSFFLYTGISLIMPGALGNVFDRIVRPQAGVVDFIKVDLNFWPFNPWPIFNIADVYLTIGMILILIDFFVQERKKPARNEGPEHSH